MLIIYGAPRISAENNSTCCMFIAAASAGFRLRNNELNNGYENGCGAVWCVSIQDTKTCLDLLSLL